MFFLEVRKYGTYIPQILSFWVLLLGYLVFKSGFLPRFLGILLMLGGLCYTVAGRFYSFFFPNFDATLFGLFAFIGESLFYSWLLIKGVKGSQHPGMNLGDWQQWRLWEFQPIVRNPTILSSARPLLAYFVLSYAFFWEFLVLIIVILGMLRLQPDALPAWAI